MRAITILVLAGLPLFALEPLAQRIGHTDPSKYRRSRSHDSAGDMACETLLPGSALTTNLQFMHRCQIMPGGGVGHHFHNQCEEMFIVFDGQAEFTIDGRDIESMVMRLTYWIEIRRQKVVSKYELQKQGRVFFFEPLVVVLHKLPHQRRRLGPACPRHSNRRGSCRTHARTRRVPAGSAGWCGRTSCGAP